MTMLTSLPLGVFLSIYQNGNPQTAGKTVGINSTAGFFGQMLQDIFPDFDVCGCSTAMDVDQDDKICL